MYKNENICLLDASDGSGLSGEGTLNPVFSQFPAAPKVKGLLYFYDMSSKIGKVHLQEVSQNLKKALYWVD